MNDSQVFACVAIGLIIGAGIGYGAAIRWATIHLRRRLEEQANQICFEYAKDRELMAGCLRAAGVLPFESAGSAANAPDTGI